MATRLEPLDWLRGLMALSIMLYHLIGRSDADTLLGKLGIYGVSIFFILSGLSMAIAYDRYIKNLWSAGNFFVRRLFRIWPLFWLAVALVATRAYLFDTSVSATTIALNLTTLFGFVAPARYINTGAWSIGNEMVYYAFTPAFIAAYHWRKWFGNAVTIVSVFIGMLFAFYLLNPSAPLANQWPVYINPFNNLFLYCVGLAIYYNFRDVEFLRQWHLPLLLLAIASFFFFPSSGDQINIVTGVNRVAMSLISAVVVLVFYKCPPILPKLVGDKLEQLGIATYGIYLLHPIVIDSVKIAFDAIGIHNSYLLVFLVVGLTIVTSLFTFRFIESPIIKIGKQVTQGGGGKSDERKPAGPLVPD
jgi:exopolysaccharide production protein ExoZ